MYIMLKIIKCVYLLVLFTGTILMRLIIHRNKRKYPLSGLYESI